MFPPPTLPQVLTSADHPCSHECVFFYQHHSSREIFTNSCCLQDLAVEQPSTTVGSAYSWSSQPTLTSKDHFGEFGKEIKMIKNKQVGVLVHLLSGFSSVGSPGCVCWPTLGSFPVPSLVSPALCFRPQSRWTGQLCLSLHV